MKRTELKRKTPLLARAPIKPGTKRLNAVSHTKKRRREQAAGPSMGDLRPHIWTRSGGFCEQCERAVHYNTFHAHHRKFRSRGGKDLIENLVVLCDSCHRWAHREGTMATKLGFAVPSRNNEGSTPILLWGRRWVFLQPDGSYWDATKPWIEETS